MSAVGARTLAMAQRVGHHVAPGLAPACPPGFFTDGFRDYLTALLRHYGQWGQPVRWQATAPAPKPRWLPLPGVRYAQVGKSVRRRRLVRVRHRGVFGTLEAIPQGLAGGVAHDHPSVIRSRKLKRHNGVTRCNLKASVKGSGCYH